jgi:hypothetical protein
MRAYFAAILFLLAMVIAPWLIKAATAMDEVGNILETPTTVTTVSSDWVQLIPPLVIER